MTVCDGVGGTVCDGVSVTACDGVSVTACDGVGVTACDLWQIVLCCCCSASRDVGRGEMQRWLKAQGQLPSEQHEEV